MQGSVRRFKRYVKRLSVALGVFTGVFALYHISDKKLESDMVVVAEECRCQAKSEAKDPWEKPLKYIYGNYSGRCLPSCEYRYTDILHASKIDQKLIVTNVYHEKQFWKATIPLHAVESVEIFFENFRKSFNHVAVRFQFQKGKPVRLESQLPGENGTQYSTTQSLIVSPEGVAPEGEEYNLYDGILGHYGLMYRLLSTEQYDMYMDELDRPLRSYKTKLDKKEMNELLLVSLDKSSEGLNGVYQLVFNNCATATIDLVLDSKKKLISPDWDIWDVLDPLRGIPLNQRVGTLSSLQWWDVIDAHTPPKMISRKKAKSEL